MSRRLRSQRATIKQVDQLSLMTPEVFRSILMPFLDEYALHQFQQSSHSIQALLNHSTKAIELDWHAIQRGKARFEAFLTALKKTYPAEPNFVRWIKNRLEGRGLYFYLGRRGMDASLQMAKTLFKKAHSLAYHSSARNKQAYMHFTPRRVQTHLRELAKAEEEYPNGAEIDPSEPGCPDIVRRVYFAAISA